MRLDIKWVGCERVGAVVPGNFWSCGGGFAWFARGGVAQGLALSIDQLTSLILQVLYVFAVYFMRCVMEMLSCLLIHRLMVLYSYHRSIDHLKYETCEL